jgi:hypothetical protein
VRGVGKPKKVVKTKRAVAPAKAPKAKPAAKLPAKAKLAKSIDKAAERPARSSARGDAKSIDKSAERPARSSARGDAKSIDKAVKPKRPTAPSLPLPPPPPPPPATRDELAAPRDVARLLHYGEKFGTKKIDIRWPQQQLPVPSGMIAVCDPAVAKTWKVLDRPASAGGYRVMLSVCKDGDKETLAAITIHVGRPPIERWTVAHARGQKRPKSEDQIPRFPVTTGWLALVDAGDGSPGTIAVPSDATGVMPIEILMTDGRRALALPCGNGEFAAYWAVGPDDKPVCLVIDFEAFTQKDWKAKPTS